MAATVDAPDEATLSLRSRYPRTVEAFLGMANGERALRAVLDLERTWIALNSGVPAQEAGWRRRRWGEPFAYVASADELPPVPPKDRYDVVVAGGGLGLVAGVALARRGLRVLVFDRDRVGAAHREWNISERELGALSRWGMFGREELARTVAARYDRGLISFDEEGTGVAACPLETRGVLDLALDAQAVLDLARRRFLQAGGTILEARSFRKLHMAREGNVGSVFEVEGPEGKEFYYARLAIDTMGSVSPIAMGLNGGMPFDGVCPTAGTIVEGLEGERQTGDVLVSVSPVEQGRQLIWEGFPGRAGETTVYLFYYDRTGREEARKQGLLDLFELYFEQLPRYRRLGPGGRHVKPVFGYIPARHGRAGRAAARGLLCLGDSAAGQSPLTFCGFGSFVRHIGRVAYLIDYALKNDLLEEGDLRQIGPHQANLRVAWVSGRLMRPHAGGDPASVNRIMNVFCGALREVGAEATQRFLQDRYSFSEYLRIMVTTARRYPGVFALTARALGARGLGKWAGDIAFFGADEVGRTLFRLAGRRGWRRLERLAGRLAPSIGLRLRARRTGWEAVR